MSGMWAMLWEGTGIQLGFRREDPKAYFEFNQAGINVDNCIGLYSFHNGIYSVHCDGSVHFLAAETDRNIVAAALSRDGGD